MSLQVAPLVPLTLTLSRKGRGDKDPLRRRRERPDPEVLLGRAGVPPAGPRIACIRSGRRSSGQVGVVTV